jgi:hypothetical protein
MLPVLMGKRKKLITKTRNLENTKTHKGLRPNWNIGMMGNLVRERARN